MDMLTLLFRKRSCPQAHALVDPSQGLDVNEDMCNTMLGTPCKCRQQRMNTMLQLQMCSLA